MDHFPPEIVNAITKYLNPFEAVALSQTCKHLAKACRLIYLDELNINTALQNELHLAAVVRNRFLGVRALYVFLGGSALPPTSELPQVVDRLIVTGGCPKLSLSNHVRPSALTAIAGRAKSIQTYECFLNSVRDEPDDKCIATTIGNLTKLELKCSYWALHFDWNLERWVQPCLTKLSLGAWKGSSSQWVELIASVPNLTSLKAVFCESFDTPACIELFQVCTQLKEAQIVDCAPCLLYSTVLHAALPAKQLTSLEFSRTTSEIDDMGEVTIGCVKTGIQTLKRLELIGIDGSFVRDDALTFIYTNCEALRRCYTEREPNVHLRASSHRRLMHPDWSDVEDLWVASGLYR